MREDNVDVMSVAETIATWRSLPEEERRRICWQRIPEQVADSMAFEREPVDITWIEAQHCRRVLPMPRKSAKSRCRFWRNA